MAGMGKVANRRESCVFAMSHTLFQTHMRNGRSCSGIINYHDPLVRPYFLVGVALGEYYSILTYLSIPMNECPFFRGEGVKMSDFHNKFLHCLGLVSYFMLPHAKIKIYFLGPEFWGIDLQ